MFFMHIKMLHFLFLFACMLFVLFVRVESSCKKKIIIIKRFKSTLIPSFTILLTCTPLILPIENLFIRTYFYLWESFFFIISCKNLFFINPLQYFAITSKHKLKILILLQKAITLTYFLSVRTYSHHFFIIQNLFSFVCIHFDQ